MRFVTAAQIAQCLAYPELIAALASAFCGNLYAPARHHHSLGPKGQALATHLLMSAWSTNAPGPKTFIGTKIVNVFPSNALHALPAVLGQYVLQSGTTGAPLATMDGTSLTHWRTAATSALAASYLARGDASHLLMVGAGALAPFLIRAHASIRPIGRVSLWNHHAANAQKLAQTMRAEGLGAEGLEIAVVENLGEAAARADIISCATLSSVPLVLGQWLRPGTHLDLVGAFNMHMRECDNAAIAAARVFVDTPAALIEGGDVAQAIQQGAIVLEHVVADLAALCTGQSAGRTNNQEITLFKSIGASIEDLAAAILVWQKLNEASEI